MFILVFWINLSCFDYLNLACDTFSYISYAHSHCKWLNHLIGKLQNQIELKSLNVFYDMIGSDHLPIHVNLYIPEKNSFKNHLNINSNEENEHLLIGKL